jgi:hypothetical protein
MKNTKFKKTEISSQSPNFLLNQAQHSFLMHKNLEIGAGRGPFRNRVNFSHVLCSFFAFLPWIGRMRLD